MWNLLVSLILCINFRRGYGNTLPAIINAHSTSIGKDTVTLSWTVSGTSDENYRNEIVYLVYDKTQNPNTRSTKTVQTAKDITTASLNGLRSGTTYEAQIHTKTDAKDGPWSTKILFTTSGVRPPRTLNIRAITDTTITVYWSPPIGDPPDYYVITLQRSDDPDGVVPVYAPVAHPATEFTLWNLKPQTPYSLYIQTKVGEELSTKMKHGFRTNVVTVVSASNDPPEETTVLIKWETTSRYHIARYDVEIIDSQNPDLKTRSQILKTHGNQEVRQLLVKDLKPGRTYSYRVRSVYRINGGRGQWSDVKYFTTKLPDPPPMPTNGEITDHAKTSALFRWAAPNSVLTILNYEIQYGKKNERPEPLVSTSSSQTSYLLSDLESGTNYTVRVRAIATHNLTGNWSTYSAFTTNGPKPPSSISITEITDSSTIIGWTTYSGETADQIKIVIIEAKLQEVRQTKVVDGNKTRLLISSLKPVTGYIAQVLVLKGGEVSSVRSLGFATNVNLDVLSKQPKHPMILARSGSQPLSELYFEFDKIPNIVIKYYTVQIEGFSVPNLPFDRTETFPPTVGGSRQSVKLDNIQSGYKYKIKARGVFSDDSEGKWSTEIATIVPGPRPVRGISMRDITSKDVTVTWQSGYAETDLDFSKQEYIISLYQYADGDSSSDLRKMDELTAGAYDNQIVFTDKLEASRRYNVKIVTRINTLPKGEQYSTPKYLAFRANSKRLDAPEFKSIHREKNLVTVTWKRLANRKDIDYYEIEIKESSGNFKKYTTPNGLTDSFLFSDIKEKTLYIFRVRAVDVSGDRGPWLTESFNLNRDFLMEKVQEIQVLKKTPNTVTLLWKAPTSTQLKMYEIELWSPARSTREFIVTKVLTNEYKLEDLHPGTSYSYRVRTVGVNENNKGPWSQIQTFSTEGASEDSISTGTIIAAIVGAIVLVIAIIVLIVLCKKRQKNVNRNRFNVRFSKNDDGIKEIA